MSWVLDTRVPVCMRSRALKLALCGTESFYVRASRRYVCVTHHAFCCTMNNIGLKSGLTTKSININFDEALEMEGQAQTSSGVSLGKGAWDCDAMVAIPPEKEVHCNNFSRTILQLL